ncbi:acyl carrier protein [Chitinophaga polysaccharea]|uniref:acyl carrier protein n=1 Tax=Chitinophaga TaxID=79328 RepID=UPI0014550B56|nr:MULTISPECIES: phosphopantetheine-binding protein [Chitinophaga]NLR57668.1 acyl carrier protein [Chitinophaga polysaccharea]NLU93260.1 acyl carrier protein [Chitinophaga sp. Ak27]
MEVRENIRAFIGQHLIVFNDDVSFTDEDNIFELGFVNSLFAMKLLNYVEHTFDIVLENEDIDINNFSSVNNIERLIAGKLSSTAGNE